MNGCKKENVDIPIDTLYEYFKKLNENDDEAETFLDNICDNQIYDDILNGDITADEALNATKNLKNHNAAGIDDFVNEYFKYSSQQLVIIYCKLFNLVFKSVIVPETWLNGVIRPIYKHKGDANDPDNYRAITLISCVGKLFTSILSTVN
jgi:hypothetical protein